MGDKAMELSAQPRPTADGRGMVLRAKLTIRNEKMVAARERKGMTQRALANAAATSLPNILALEAMDYRRKCLVTKALYVAEALGLGVEDVLPSELVGTKLGTTQVSKGWVPMESLQAAASVQVEGPERAVMMDDLRESVLRQVRTLPDRMAEVITMRFGLDGQGARTLEDVGAKFMITRERVRQIEAKGLRELRHPRHSRELSGALEEFENE